jgi:predicted phosphodiesterase
LIGEQQIHTSLQQIAEDKLRIAVMHHPFDWLNMFDRNRTESRLYRACHFILCGHVHDTQVQVIQGTAGEAILIPAGASYERRTANNPRYTNAYNW